MQLIQADEQPLLFAFGTSVDLGLRQAKVEPYIIKHWELIQGVIAGKRPVSSLPNSV